MPDFFVEIDRCDGSPKEKIGPFKDDRVAAYNEAMKHLEEGVIVELKADAVMCDFCNEENPRWVYPATDFGEFTTKFASIGDWGACDTCKKLIQAGKWDELAQRAFDNSPTASILNDTMRPTVLRAIKEMHTGFAKARTGGPYPVEERISDNELEDNNG